MEKILRLFRLLMMTVAGGLFLTTVAYGQWSGATYVGERNTNAAERFNYVHRLPDNTFLVCGSADNLNWAVAAGATIHTLDLSATTYKSYSGLSPYNLNSTSTKVAFIAHFNESMTQVLKVVRFPANTVESVDKIRVTVKPWGPASEYTSGTAKMYISGQRNGDPNVTDGYYIAKLDHNFLDATPDDVLWFYNAECGSVDDKHETDYQPWDVTSSGDVVVGEGAYMNVLNGPTGTPPGLFFPDNYYNAWVRKISGTDASYMVVPEWLMHTTDNGQSWVTSQTFPGTPSGSPNEWSAIRMKSAKPGSLRSPDSATFVRSFTDENGNLVYGGYPDDYYVPEPCEPGNCPGGGDTNLICKVYGLPNWPGAGYTGYRQVNYSHGIGEIAIDRRNGDIYLGYNVKTLLPTYGSPINYGDFEPALVAFTANGSLKWYRRMYNQNERSTPDHYVDDLAIDYANDQIAVIARAHGNNTNNLFSGNQLTYNSSASGFQNNFTGTNGNIHLQWIGKYTLGTNNPSTAGRIMHATYWGEFLDQDGNQPFADPNLDGWGDPNTGWATLNTTSGAREMFLSRGGSVCATNTGRRTITTKTAFQKMIKPGPSNVYPDASRSSWNSFARVYTPDLSSVRYSTIMTGAWNRLNEQGGNNTKLKHVYLDNDTLYVVGYHHANFEGGPAKPNPIGDAFIDLPPPNSMSQIPTTNWTDSVPFGESAIMAKLPVPKDSIQMNIAGEVFCKGKLVPVNYKLPADVGYQAGDVFELTFFADNSGAPGAPITTLPVKTTSGFSVSAINVPVIEPGSSPYFNGTNTAGAGPDVANYALFDTAFTVAAFIKTEDGEGVIIEQANNAGPTNGFRFGVGLDAGAADNGFLSLMVGDGTDTYNFLATGGDKVNDDQWHHVAVVFDGYNAYFYIDGKLNASVYGSGALFTIGNTAENLSLARSRVSGGSQYFGGYIRNVQLWDAVMVANDVVDNMFTPVTMLSNLQAHWPMDEAAGTTLADNSTNTNPLSMFGTTAWLDNMGFATTSANYWVTCDVSGSTTQKGDTVQFYVSDGPPVTPTKPLGNRNVCKSGTSVFELTLAPGTETYLWELSEYEAGTIVTQDSGNLSRAVVTWNPAYPVDTVSIYAIGYNECGASPKGDTLFLNMSNNCIVIDPNLSGSTFCPTGVDIMTVEFQVPDGTLPNQDNISFGAGNRFILQLSDNQGYFNAPITVLATSDDPEFSGSASGLGSDINVSNAGGLPSFTLPAPNVAASDDYRLRVIAEEPDFTPPPPFIPIVYSGSEVDVQIKLLPLPPGEPWVKTETDKFGDVILGKDYLGDDIVDPYVTSYMGGICPTGETYLQVSTADSAAFGNPGAFINDYTSQMNGVICNNVGDIFYRDATDNNRWTEISLPAVAGTPLNGIGYVHDIANRQITVVGDNGTILVSTAQNGQYDFCGGGACSPFTQIAVPGFIGTNDLNDIWSDRGGTAGIAGNGYSLVVGDNGLIFKMGSYWTAPNLDEFVDLTYGTANYEAVARNVGGVSGNSNYVVVGSGGTIIRTTDGGTSFTQINIPGSPTETFYDIAASGRDGEFWAVGENGIVVHIQDAFGTPIVNVAAPATTETLRSIDGASGRFIAVGDNNVMIENDAQYSNNWATSQYAGISPFTLYRHVVVNSGATGPIPSWIFGSNGRGFFTPASSCTNSGQAICSMGNSPDVDDNTKYRGLFVQTYAVEGALDYQWTITPASAGTITKYQGIDTLALILYDTTFTGSQFEVTVSAQTECIGVQSPAKVIKVFDCTPITNIFNGDEFCVGETFTLRKSPGPLFAPTGGTQDVYVELSDANGDFSSPMLIGSNFNCGGCEAVDITIPPNIPSSANYKIRVIADIGNNDYENITAPFHYSNPVTVTIKGGSPSGELATSPVLSTICPTNPGEGTMTFTTTGTIDANQYIWEAQPASSVTSWSDGDNADGTATTANTVLSNTITWNPAFVGTAYVTVKSQSSCGVGPPTVAKAITFDCAPPVPPTPLPGGVVTNTDSSVTVGWGTGVTASQNLYRTRKSGLWSDPNVWERFNGTEWVRTDLRTFGPNGRDGQIVISQNDTVWYGYPNDTAYNTFSGTGVTINEVKEDYNGSEDYYMVGDNGYVARGDEVLHRNTVYDPGTTQNLQGVWTEDASNEAEEFVAIVGDNGTAKFSTNSGLNWDNMNKPGANPNTYTGVIALGPNDLLAVDNATNNVYHTTDGGVNWSTTAPGSSGANPDHFSDLIKFDENSWLAAVSSCCDNNNDRMWITGDSGTTWIRATDNWRARIARAVDGNGNGRAFAIDSWGSIFWGWNDGLNWTRRYQPPSNLGDVVTFNGGDVFTADNAGSGYQTTDVGVNWVTPGDYSSEVGSQELRDAAVSPDGTRIMAIVYNELVRSADGGNNWISENLPSHLGNNQAWCVEFSSNDTVFASKTRNGADVWNLSISIDGGNNWTEVHNNGGWNNGRLRGMAFDHKYGWIVGRGDHDVAGDPPRAYLTRDGGETWADWSDQTAKFVALGTDLDELLDVEMIVSGGKEIAVFVGDNGKTYISTNAKDANPTISILANAQHPNASGENWRRVEWDGTYLWLVGNRYIYRSGDLAGDFNAWTQVYDLGNNTLINGITNQGGSNYLAVTAGFEVLKSTDNGDTWSVIPSSALDPTAVEYYGIAVNGKNVAGSGSTNFGAAAGENGMVMITNDQGGNWTGKPTGGTETLRDIYSFPSSIEDLLVVGDDGAIYQTSNGFTGAPTTWTQRTSGTTQDLKAVYCNGNNSTANEDTLIAVGNNGTIITSYDRGVTWTVRTSNTGSNLTSVVMYDHLNGYAAGAEGAWVKTTDGGQTWVNSDPFAGVNFTDIDGTNTGYDYHLWITSSDGKIYRSTDADNNGVTLSELTTGVTEQLNAIVSRASGSESDHTDDKIMAVGNNGTAIVSIDGGANFTASTIPVAAQTEDLLDVHCHYFGNLYIVGTNGTILHSNDNGVTFTTVTPPVAGLTYEAVYTEDNAGELAVASGNRVWYSTNHGATWTERFSAPAGITIKSLANKKGLILAGTNGYVETINHNYDIGDDFNEVIIDTGAVLYEHQIMHFVDVNADGNYELDISGTHIYDLRVGTNDGIDYHDIMVRGTGTYDYRKGSNHGNNRQFRVATWLPGSTVRFSWDGASLLPLNFGGASQQYYNVNWAANQSGDISIDDRVNNLQDGGTFTVETTGSGKLFLSTDDATMPIYPNFTLEDGDVVAKEEGTTSTAPFTITNNFTINGGTFTNVKPANGRYVFARCHVKTHNFYQNGGTYTTVKANNLAEAGWTLLNQLTVSGDFIQTAGSLYQEETATSTTAAYSEVLFNGTGDQDFRLDGAGFNGNWYVKLEKPSGALNLLGDVTMPFVPRGGTLTSESSNPNKSFTHVSGDINLNGHTLTTRYYMVAGSVPGAIVGAVNGGGILSADTVQFDAGIVDNSDLAVRVNSYHPTRAIRNTSSRKYFIGGLERRVGTGAITDLYFPIGLSDTEYREFVVTDADYSSGGLMEISVFDGAPGAADNNPMNLEPFSNKPYWQMDLASGLAFSDLRQVKLTDGSPNLGDTSRIGQAVDAGPSANGIYVNRGILRTDSVAINDQDLAEPSNVSYFLFARPGPLKPTVYIPAKPGGGLNAATEVEYNNLTTLSREYNQSLLKWDVNVYITDAYEGDDDGAGGKPTPPHPEVWPIVFRQNPGNFNVTIQRHASDASMIHTGGPDSVNAVIEFDGADNITIDGSIGGNNMWTFTNRAWNTNRAYNFHLYNDAQNNVITNLEVNAPTLAPAVPFDTSAVYPDPGEPGSWIAKGSAVNDCQTNGPTGTPGGRLTWEDTVENYYRGAFVAQVSGNVYVSPNSGRVNSIVSFNDRISDHWNTTGPSTSRPLPPQWIDEGYSTVLNSSPHPWCIPVHGMRYEGRTWYEIPGGVTNTSGPLNGGLGGEGYSGGVHAFPHNGRDLTADNTGQTYFAGPGSAAQLNYTVSGGAVTGVSVANGGSGYTADNGTANGNIAIRLPGNGTNFDPYTGNGNADGIAIATVTGGVISAIDLVRGAICTQVDGGSGGKVDNIYSKIEMVLSDVGFNYTSPTLVGGVLNPANLFSFELPNPYGSADKAELFVRVNNLGFVNDAYMQYEQLDMNTSTGTGYVNGLVATIAGGAQVTLTTDPNTGAITNVAVTNAGSGYTKPGIPNYSFVTTLGDQGMSDNTNDNVRLRVRVSGDQVVAAQVANPTDVHVIRNEFRNDTLLQEYSAYQARYDSAFDAYQEVVDQASIGTLRAITLQTEAAVYFGASNTASGGGNSNNTVSNLNIKGYDNRSNFVIGIMSHNENGFGSLNENNAITNNTLDGSRFRSIFVSPTGNGGGWNISGNHIFTSEPGNSMLAANGGGIYFEPGGSSNDNFITNNFIGGTTVNAGGTAPNTNSWNFTNSRFSYKGIYAKVGGTDTTRITGNVVRKFEIPKSEEVASDYGFAGIHVDQGLAYISHNTIGTPGDTMYLQVGTDNNSLHVRGIDVRSNSSTIIEQNTVTGLATLSSQGNVVGINYAGSGAATIRHNTISNLYNQDDDNVYDRTAVIGIRTFSTSSQHRINNNDISRLVVGGMGTLAQRPFARSIGIGLFGTNGGGHVFNNKIYRQHAIYRRPTHPWESRSGDIYSTAGWLEGIVIGTDQTGSKGWQVFNNMISITNFTGTNETSGWRSNFKGIVLGPNLNSGSVGIYHNSIFLGGYTLSGAPSGGPGGACYGITRAGTVNWVVKNNLVVGPSNIASGTIYGIKVPQLTVAPLTSDYNLLATLSPSTIIEHTDGVSKSLDNWMSTLNDQHTWVPQSFDKAAINGGAETNAEGIDYEELFVDAINGDLRIDWTVPAAWYVSGKGVAGNRGGKEATDDAVLTDVEGDLRSGLYHRGVDLGADERTSDDLPTMPPAAITFDPKPGDGVAGTQTFMFGGRDIATVTWNPEGTKPDLNVHYFSGVFPPHVPVTYKPLHSYYQIDVDGADGAGYKYKVALRYSPALLGNISESRLDSIKMIKRSAPYDMTSPWIVRDQFKTPPDAANFMYGNSAFAADVFDSFSQFSGTDTNFLPLPVSLLFFRAYAMEQGVMTKWATQSERNNSHFIVERSVDGENFVDVGRVEGAGNSRTQIGYNFLDEEATELGVTKLYYRLRQVDFDGTFAHSQIEEVTLELTNFSASAFPNPFNNALNIGYYLPEAGDIKIEMFDMFGRLVVQERFGGTKGSNRIEITEMQNFAKGMYIVRFRFQGKTKIMKVVKE